MASLKSQKPVCVIVGLGITGLACARFLHAEGRPFKVVDSRPEPPALAEFSRLFPEAEVELGEFREATFRGAAELIVSPGVGLETPAIARAREAGVPISGDIDLFARRARKPVIAITGSNGKSTVAALVAAILEEAGHVVGLGGNLDASHGKPALDLLSQGGVEFYVLELSSFQLETTANLKAEVATILNLSEDHMDRYDSLAAYHQAKLRIFNGCRQVVVNHDSPYSAAPEVPGRPLWEFGFGEPGAKTVGVVSDAGEQFIAWHKERILPVRELKIAGRHNLANAMAAVALTLAVQTKVDAIRNGLRRFPGLPHRCQWVRRLRDVDFYNDSKGTNVGATVAAIEGLGQHGQGRVILIAGGQGKGANFQPLGPVLDRWGKAVVLIGEDAARIADCLGQEMQVSIADSMEEAVSTAAAAADPGDVVLLSPACASFDMFDNFAHRGREFTRAVEALQ
ncbi:MAG: UDP-N-acetylmuramoyl-L-alanine--D-glutamate ligase [Pseudohongiellaceae bacterium]